MNLVQNLDPRTQAALDLARRIGDIDRQAEALFAEREHLVGEFEALMNLPLAQHAPASEAQEIIAPAQPAEGLTAQILAVLDADPAVQFRAADLAVRLDRSVKVISPTLATLAKHDRVARVDVGLYQSKRRRRATSE